MANGLSKNGKPLGHPAYFGSRQVQKSTVFPEAVEAELMAKAEAFSSEGHSVTRQDILRALCKLHLKTLTREDVQMTLPKGRKVAI